MFARGIAEDLDCSYQLVGKRGKILADRGLVSRTENKQGRPLFELTKTAEERYFMKNNSDELNVGNEWNLFENS